MNKQIRDVIFNIRKEKTRGTQGYMQKSVPRAVKCCQVIIICTVRASWIFPFLQGRCVPLDASGMNTLRKSHNLTQSAYRFA